MFLIWWYRRIPFQSRFLNVLDDTLTFPVREKHAVGKQQVNLVRETRYSV